MQERWRDKWRQKTTVTTPTLQSLELFSLFSEIIHLLNSYRVKVVNAHIFYVGYIKKAKSDKLHYCRHFPCCGKHCDLSGILTSPSAALSSEVENWDFLRVALCLKYYVGLLMITQEFYNTKISDVCCIFPPCWHWKLCHYQALDRYSCNSIGRGCRNPPMFHKAIKK